MTVGQSSCTGRRVFLHDYAGHPFTYELARSLAEGPDSVSYAYCAATVAPHGALRATSRLNVIALGRGWRFERYRLVRRIWSELRLGWASARAARQDRSDEVITCNMPVLSLVVITLGARLQGARMVVWFQDAQGRLAGSVATRGRTSGWVGALLGWVEGWVLRRADRVIAISPAMVDQARRMGVPPARLRLLDNWAPLEQLPLRPRDNPWASQHGFVDATTVLYSGTLARKHNPHLLVELARQLPWAQVVAITEGEGADELRRAVGGGVSNLTVLPYQPFEDLPDVLASADVLLTVLDPLASAASVPSKVWSYLCAGRPIVAAIPSTNRAAEVLMRAEAGVVVDPNDSDALVEAVRALCADRERCQRLGANGRRYAESCFAGSSVTKRFLDAARGAPTPHEVPR